MANLLGIDGGGNSIYISATGAGTNGDPFIIVHGLPTGAATAALQTTGNSLLTGIAAQLAGTITVTITGTPTVTVGSALPSGTNVIGHVILDASSAVVGHVIIDANTAVIGHVILDAGAAVIGHVIVDSGVITTVSTVTAVTTVTTVTTVSTVSACTLTAGELHLGEVGSPNLVLVDNTAVSTSPAYTSGDCVGAARTLTAATRVSAGKVVLESITLVDTSNQKVALTILFFNQSPGAGTYTDNAAIVLSTDAANLVGKVNIAATDYETIGATGVAVACKTGLGLEMQSVGSSNLYAVIFTTGTPTYALTTAVKVYWAFLQG